MARYKVNIWKVNIHTRVCVSVCMCVCERERVFIYLSLFKFSLGNEFWIDIFFFQQWRSFHRLLACMVSDKNCVVFLTLLLYRQCVFPTLISFKTFSLSSVFSSLNVFRCEILWIKKEFCLMFSEFLRSVVWRLSLIWGKFWPLFLPQFLLSILFSFCL